MPTRRPTDRAQLGAYYAHTKFGCITFCNSPDFNGVDGILGKLRPPRVCRLRELSLCAGFGLPGMDPQLPVPLFFALTDQNQPNNDFHLIPTAKFAFFSTEKAGADVCKYLRNNL